MRITTSTPEKVTISASSGRQRITFEGNSEVRIFEDTGNAIGMRRSGDDLVIQMRNGETVQIVDYYNAPSDIEVYFVDDAGQIWVMENILGTEQFVFTRADDDGGAAAFADMGLLGLAGLLGLGAAAAGMGGGGDGEGEDGDTTPPAAPGLELAEDTGESDSDGITNNNVVNVTGVEAGASWEYSYDGGETWHQGSGDSFTLPDGDYEDGDILVHQTDQAGNQSEDGTLGGVSVDTEAPDAPSIGEVVDDAGDDTGALSSGDLTDDATPTVSGTGTPGDTITLYDGDTEIGSAEVDADGNWEITPSTPLDDGEHSLTVTATDPAGNESASSEAFVVEVDATAPDAPDASEITVTDDVDPITGTLEDGDDTNDTLPTFAGAAGSATAGDTVTVYA
ncbi:Ig-like domain-containing protein, partial [Tritonibacter mobilis]|uniref:Ig-like domain-containing protein n=1 Tax=Tritonibacter mobilis TaxID=379347 RepID=UPI0013B42D53